MIYLLFIVAVLALVGSRCSPTPPEPPQSVNMELSTEPVVSGSGEGEDLVGLSFVTYTNRAVGYTILRPNNWYWRHYIASEINHLNPSVVDYFITDDKPLSGLGSGYLGQIVIEVSTRELSDYAAEVSNFSSRETIVAGVPAVRYEGEKLNQNGELMRVVEYHFRYNDRTFRIIYNNSTKNNNEQTVFEQVVSSFKFSN